MTINPSPKDRFLQDTKAVNSHRDLMQRDDLQHSVDMAMLEYQRVLSETQQENFNLAAANHFRINGALEFVRVLRALGESPKRPSGPVTDNLDHKS